MHCFWKIKPIAILFFLYSCLFRVCVRPLFIYTKILGAEHVLSELLYIYASWVCAQFHLRKFRNAFCIIFSLASGLWLRFGVDNSLFESFRVWVFVDPRFMHLFPTLGLFWSIVLWDIIQVGNQIENRDEELEKED